MTVGTDARALNWRFVAPSEPPGMLLLPVNGETAAAAHVVGRGADDLPAALRHGPFPAVAAPDIGPWVRAGGRRGARRLVADLAAAVAPGGWLFAGFSNSNYPPRPHRNGSLSASGARRVLSAAGLVDVEVFAALPDQRRPALLVPLSRRAEMDHVLEHLFLTYLPDAGRWATLRRRLLWVARSGALAAPHGARAALVPALCCLARRPP